MVIYQIPVVLKVALLLQLLLWLLLNKLLQNVEMKDLHLWALKG